MYRMQDYVDAQFGGPGRGFYRIVHAPVRGPAGRSTPGRWPWSWASRPACRSAARSTRSRTDGAGGGDHRRPIDRAARRGARRSACARWSWSTSSTTRCPGRRRRGRDRRGGELRQLPRDRDLLGHAALRAGGPGRPRPQPAGRARTISARAAGRAVRRDRAALRRGDLPALPAYPPPDHCNSRGLTTLGEHTIAGLAKRHMLFDPDHMSVKARTTALDQTARMGYPRRAVEPLLVDRRTPTRASTGRAGSSRRTPATRPASSRSGAGTSAGRTRATTSGSATAPTSTASAPRATRAARTSPTRSPTPSAASTVSGSPASTPGSGSTTSTPTASRSTASTRTGSRT